MKLKLFALALGLSCSTSTHAAQMLTFEGVGMVHNTGMQNLPAGARISQAAIAVAPDAHAYLLGAALLRQQQVIPQSRQKAGLLHDLTQLARNTDDAPAIAAIATRMAERFEAMPVTGRQLQQLLEPRSLEVTRARDGLLQEGDRLVYPARPTTVTVTGAVSNECPLPHEPLLAPADYRSHCALHPAASRDEVYVIQPDGDISRHGIALWNRSPPSSVAPGAVIYIPLSESDVRRIAPEVNEDAARFLATQLLGTAGASP